MGKAISSKSPKNEILQAYQEALSRLEEQGQGDPQVDILREQEKETVEKASQFSMDSIVRNLTDTKLSMVKALDVLEEQMVAEQRKLAEIQRAIEIQAAHLQTLYGIGTNAEALSALLLAQAEKKKEFETQKEQETKTFEEQREQKRAIWQKEQEALEQSSREANDSIGKERRREEEQYTYELELRRKKDNDAYEAEKAALQKDLEDKRVVFERELSQRESALAERERALSDLRDRAESFPAELNRAVAEAQAALKREIELDYKHQAALTKAELDSERKLSQQTISALEAKIKEQDEQIRQLSKKADEAAQQVQNIAIKAIEGAAHQRIPSMTYDRNKERE